MVYGSKISLSLSLYIYMYIYIHIHTYLHTYIEELTIHVMSATALFSTFQ